MDLPAWPTTVPPSGVPGVGWPSVPPVPTQIVLSLLWQLERTQWWRPEQLRAHQLGQLRLVLHHAARTTRHWRRVTARAGLDLDRPLPPDALDRLPILTRQHVQEQLGAITSTAPPKEHGSLHELSSTGSSGRPVTVRSTALAGQLWHANTLREHLWHRRDPSLTLGVIRHMGDEAEPPHGARGASWGASTDLLTRTGPCVLLSVHATTDQHAAWLSATKPDYLLAYPTVLRALAHWYRDRGVAPPPLRGLRSISEMVSDDARAICREVFGLPIVDTYSTQECGYLAIECPEHGNLHACAESAIVEVVHDDGAPCGPGEVGRVLVTPLHNFATVLVRYEVGDRAEVGPPCPCGRGLPVLARVAGRQRSHLLHPDGSRSWPRIHADKWMIGPLRQFQIVQTARDHIEARLVSVRPLTTAEHAAVLAGLREAMGPQFTYGVKLVDAIARGPGGKFPDFLSELG